MKYREDSVAFWYILSSPQPIGGRTVVMEWMDGWSGPLHPLVNAREKKSVIKEK